MKYLKYKCLLAIILGCSLSGCFDLTEEVFDRVDSGVYYQDETVPFQLYHVHLLLLVAKP